MSMLHLVTCWLGSTTASTTACCLSAPSAPSCSAELDLAFEDIAAWPLWVLKQLAGRLGLQVGKMAAADKDFHRRLELAPLHKSARTGLSPLSAHCLPTL